MAKDEKTCGFVAVLGAPNAGKSTLVNALVGTKVSIVSPKVQTTRMRVRGIAIEGKAQIILVDTPGIFKPKRRLDRAMVAAAWAEAGDAEVSLLVVDASKPDTSDTEKIIAAMKKLQGKDIVLVLNKIDLIAKEKLLALTQKLTAAGDGIFSDTFMISAATGECVEDLKAFLAAKMPKGDWLFPAEDASDLPLRQLAAEIVREKAFFFLQDELPYSLAVETESFEEKSDGSYRIAATIFVERVGQRKIVIGAGGSKIKTISVAARKELEETLSAKVHLFLEVKVAENWGEDSRRYQSLGLDYNA